jgi:hypothetical protein
MNATETTTAGTFEGKTAAEWRAAALRDRQRSAESFDRCDTDGFLTQAALDATARECNLKAEVADEGGTWLFEAAFDLDGKLVAIEIRDGQYGAYYLNIGPSGNTAPRFINPSNAQKEATRVKNNAKKGFYIGSIRVTPEVKFGGGWSWIPYCSIPAGTKLADVQIVDNGK